jgi:hypothetical protein
MRAAPALTVFALALVAAFGASACMSPAVTLDHGVVSVPRGIGVDVAVEVDGQPLTDLTGVTWHTDAPATVAIAIVDQAVRVTGLTEGRARVELGYADDTPATLEVDVTPATVIAVSIDPTTLELDAGGTALLAATATDSLGWQRDVTTEVSWQLDDPQIATVELGLLHATTDGVTLLHARLGDATNSIAVTIVPVMPTPTTLARVSARGPPGSTLAGHVWAKLAR